MAWLNAEKGSQRVTVVQLGGQGEANNRNCVEIINSPSPLTIVLALPSRLYEYDTKQI